MPIGKEEKQLLLGAGLLAILYYGIIRPVTDKIGLTQTQKEKELDAAAEIAGNNPGWDPNFWIAYPKKHPGTYYIANASKLTAWANQIYKAWGLVNDDEQAIYSVFRLVRSQIELSALCAKYNELYKQDLLLRLRCPWYYLKDGLDISEFQEISKIVNKLPIKNP
ncbi:MAG: hypothetical protein ABIQ31_05755 [Ferruginibacter sp.]